MRDTDRLTTGRLGTLQPSPPCNADACIHHWLIESPSGLTAPARCRKCGAVHEFNASYCVTYRTLASDREDQRARARERLSHPDYRNKIA